MRFSAVLLSTLFVLAYSGAAESMVARHISPDLQYRLTILITLIVGSGLSLVAYLKQRRAFYRALRAGWPFLLFGAIAIASTAWSLNRVATFPASVSASFFILGTIALCALVSWEELLAGMALGALLLGLLSLALIPFGGLMTEVHEGALRGPFGEKNRAGMVFAMGAIACMAVGYSRRRIIWFSLLPVFLLLLWLSESGTSLISAALALAALSYCEILRGRSSRLILGVWCGLMIVASLGWYVSNHADIILTALGEDSSLTGRSKIWPSVLWRIREAPLLGYGYDSFWREDNPSLQWLRYEAGFEVFNAHNGWFETMLSIGLIGTLPLIWVFGRTGLAGLVGLNARNDPRRMAIPFLLMVLMTSMTESAIGGPDGIAWLVFLLIGTKAAMGETRAAPASAKPPQSELFY